MASRKPVVSIRRPPASKPDPIAVDQFVNGQKSLDVQVSGGSDVPASGSSDVQVSGLGIVQRRDGRVRRRMTVYLPPDLAKKLKIHAVIEDREISDVVAEAVEKLLGC